MKKNIKSTLSAILVAIMLIGMIPIEIFATVMNGNSVEISNGYLQVKVSRENGGFLIDTLEGDKLNKADNNKYLLYPDEDYDTSFTSFRVERGGNIEEYIFGRDYGHLGLGKNNVEITSTSNSITAVWSVKDLTFTQTLTLENTSSTRHGMVAINYSVKTNSAEPINVQARVMLDSALGYQDYATYELTQETSEYKNIQQETIIDNKDGKAYNNAFFGYDDPKAPSITAYTVNASSEGKIIAPYQIAFGHWNNLASTVFDFIPDTDLNFTNQYNESYLTADSAYALYFDMGTVSKEINEKVVTTYYGVYSNATVNNKDSVAINFSSEPGSLKLNAEKNGYESQISGGINGDFSISAQIRNISSSEIKQVAVAVYPQEGITPYDLEGNLNIGADYSNPYQVSIVDFEAGEERQVNMNFNAQPLDITDYRSVELRCYDITNTGGDLLSENLMGSSTVYVLCPSASGDRLSFTSLTPETIYYTGTRHIYMAGKNFNLLRDKSTYDVRIKSINSGTSYDIQPENFILDAEKNTADLVLESTIPTGTYQIVFDWKDPSKADVSSEILRFNVSDDISYQGGTYGIVTIENVGQDLYQVKAYRDEINYKNQNIDPDNSVLLEFRGDFELVYENGNIVQAQAVSLETVDKKAKSTINISDSLDVEKGTVTISVENPGSEDGQSINIDIDGEVYTTGARTKVWNGVCAISPIENGQTSKLLKYNKRGLVIGDVENNVANTNAITLIWPGAASTAQTIAGMVMEFKYCQFGIMETSGDKKQRVIAFGAELSPDFLVPSNYKWSERETSPMETVQLKLAQSNYTAEQLRDVQDRYGRDQAAWEKASGGSMGLYIHDILFGGGFIGFNTSVEMSLPSYADGLPSIDGSLNLKVMNDEYEIGVKGSADLMMLEMEAEVKLRSHNGIPVPDKLYFSAGGFVPGINVDCLGIFWIKGAGGGVDKLYETIFPTSSIPPITLLLSGEFSLFTMLSARGDLSISPRGFDIGISKLGIAGITIVDYSEIAFQWYPELKFAASMNLSVLDIITGRGYIVLEQDKLKDDLFWEGFATASVGIPNKIPLFGGMNIASADLGLNAEKIWGTVHILKLDAGITYYWGGDVDFAFGKYDVTEPTTQFSLQPVYYDEENQRTLYAGLSNGIRVLATTFSEENNNSEYIDSDKEKKSHKVNLGDYTGENGIVTIEFASESESVAKSYAKGITIDDYDITWMDNTKAADSLENENANAFLSYDSKSKKASATITFTDEKNYNKDFKLNTPIAADLTLYAMEKLSTIDTFDYNKDLQTVTWDGNNLDNMESISVYATSETGDFTQVYKTEDKSEIASKTGAITIPNDMQSGEYTLRIVGTTLDKTSNPMVDASQKLIYTNPNQPSAPNFETSLGGDYSIDLTNITPSVQDEDYDGYYVNIYETENTNLFKQMFKKDSKPEPIETIFKDILIERDEAGNLPSAFVVGGQYTQTVTIDENGNVVNPSELTEEQISKTTTETKQLGLTDNKNYVVGLKAFKRTNDGGLIVSEETKSDSIKMIKPKVAKVSFDIEDAKKVGDIMTVASNEVRISVDSDIKVSGEWSLDGGVQTGEFDNKSKSHKINLFNLEEGTHTLTFKGENTAGDGVLAQILFAVDTLPPRLQISSPSNGGFFDNNITVTGITDKDAKIYIATGTELLEENPNEDGSFSTTVLLDNNVAYENISIYAKDEMGNTTVPVVVQLTNSQIANIDSELVMYLDDKDCTNTIIPAGEGGTLSLKIKTGDNIIDINEDSTMASMIEWRINTISGEANIDEENKLTTKEGVNGFVTASIGSQSVMVVLGGKDTTPDNGGGTTPTYTIMIPENVELKLNGETKEYEGVSEIIAEKVKLDKGYTLDVSINSLNDFNFKTTENATQGYTATIRGKDNPIVNNEVIAKFNTTEEKQSVFIDYIAEEPSFAGDYKDILTFNIKINKN